MTCRLLCLAVAASLLASPTAAAAKRQPQGDLNSNLARVSAFCEQTALRAPTPGLTLSSLRGIDIHTGTVDAGVPDLVKRFAARQPMAQLFSSPTFILHFRAPGGEVWALVYDGLPICNVLVTGASGDMPAVAARLAESLGGEGWQIAGLRPATAAMPLTKHILVKKIAKPGSPNFGLMLTVRARTEESAAPSGVQLEMALIAGEVVHSPGSPDVEVKVHIPAKRAGASSPVPR